MNCPSCGGVVGRDCFNPQECMEITRAQASAHREHEPREGESAIRQIQALRNFLCEDGKNRPMSTDHPVGSVIRYITELEATVQDQSETLHSMHPVCDPVNIRDELEGAKNG